MSIIGFGRTELSSVIRVPDPPARMTTFMNSLSYLFVPVNLFVLGIFTAELDYGSRDPPTGAFSGITGSREREVQQ
jgi:hypothetical protein